MCATWMLPVLLFAVLTSNKLEPDGPQEAWTAVTVSVSETHLCLCCYVVVFI